MTEQWFLDLDGVRSGPYQTNEVLGLVADGEVLPHHRIARSLKDSNWQTILDWRLEHARQIQAKRNPQAPTSPAPTSQAQSTPTPTSQVKEADPADPIPADPFSPPPIPTFSPGQSEFLKEVESLEKTMAEIPADGTKRDPMAEMFEILQNTKQKREAKQLQSAQQASLDAKLDMDKPQNLTRLIAICVAVSLVGLVLGQWFQGSSPPPSKTSTEVKPESKSETKSEVVDRSTDKMTIRAVVDKKPEPTPTRAVVVHTKPTPHAVPAQPIKETEPEAPSERKNADKDLEELRDLKKELQELKALKEQLKEAPLSDEFSEGDLGPYPDNAGGSFGGSTGNPNYPNNGSGNYPAVGPDGAEIPGGSNRPGMSPAPGDIRY